MKKLRTQIGVTILEVMLVIAIAASIVMVGINQYRVYKRAADGESLISIVSSIQDAARKYYLANCGLTGLLSPTSTSPASVDIKTALVDAGYLSSNMLPLNPLVNQGSDPALAQYAPYLLQFTKISTPRYYCTAGTDVTGTAAGQGCTTTKQIGTIINWQIQIAVKLKDSALAQSIKNITNASCTATVSGTTVPTCTTASSSDNAVVFNMMPYEAEVGKMQAGNWLFNSNLQTFTQMYATQPLNYLATTSHSPEVQYFYCGS